MTPEAVFERATTIADVRSSVVSGKAEVSGALVSAREIRAWLDAQEAGLISQLSEVDSFPEATIAETSRASLGQASKAKERSDTLAAVPALTGALAGGTITSGHVDVVTRAGKQLDAAQREQLLKTADELSGVAAAATVEQFAARMRLEAKRLQSDDGEERLTSQKRNVRLSTWTDNDGMWNLRGTFDPETGVRLFSAIDGAVATTFAEATPEHCPSDPIEKQKFLGAHALARLIDGTSHGIGQACRAVAGDGAAIDGAAIDGASADTSSMHRPARASMIVVVDADAPGHIGPVAEWAIPVELPARVVAELAGTADVTTIVVRNGVVIHAPGNLTLGRSTRLANRAQRRALRGLYRSCAIPGCSVGFDRCKIHHVVWWRHGGRTDLDNLIPVCTRHHTRIHDSEWIVELGPNRELTLRLPDGAVRSTGPPSIRAA